MTTPLLATLLIIAILAVLGKALLGSLRWIIGSHRVYRDAWIYMALQVAKWTTITVGLIFGFFVSLPLFNPIAWIVSAAVIVEVLAKRRKNRQFTLLSLLAVTTERNLPLAPVLESLAREGHGRFARRLQKLSDQLAGGVPVPEALRRFRRLLPSESLPLLNIGLRSRSLPTAFRQSIATHREFDRLLDATATRGALAIFFPMLAFSCLVFLGWKIAPSYVKIFKDFDLPLPAITQALFGFCETLIRWAWLISWAILGGFLLLTYVHTRRWGVIQWDIPPLGWLTQRLHCARVLEALALAVAQNLPLDEAIETLAQAYPKYTIRRKLQGVLHDVRAGAAWEESMHAQGLIGTAELAILRSAQETDNLPWAMRELAASSRRRFALRCNMMIQLATPVATLAFGALILFVAVGCFLPLICLITSLT